MTLPTALTDYFNESPKTIVELSKLYGLDAKSFVDHIILLLEKEIKGVTIGSLDTLQVGGQSIEKLIKEALDALRVHASRSDNPHEETVDSIGTMSGEEIYGLDLTGVPVGHVPIDIVGYNIKTWARQDLTSSFIVETNAIWLKEDLSFILYGRPVTIKSQTIQVPTSGPEELYLYIELDKGLPTLRLTSAREPDLKHRIFLTKYGRTSRLLHPVESILRVSGKRISENPSGDSIPATSGSYMHLTKLQEGWIPGSNREEEPGLVWGDIEIVSLSSDVTEYRYLDKLMLTANRGEDFQFRIIKDGEVQDLIVTNTAVKTKLDVEPVDEFTDTDYKVDTTKLGFSKIEVKSTVGNETFSETVYIRVSDPLTMVLMSTDMPYPDRGQIGPLPPIGRYSPRVNVQYKMNFVASEIVDIDMSGLDNLWPRVYTIENGINPKINLKFMSRYTASISVTGKDISGRAVTLGPFTIAADTDEPPAITLHCKGYMYTPDHADFWKNTPGGPWYQSTKNEPASNSTLNMKRWTVEFYQLPASHIPTIRMKSCITSRNHTLAFKEGVNRNIIEIDPVWVGADTGGLPMVHYFICEGEVQNGLGAKITEEFYIRIVRR